jgi:hypothetical protein
MRVFLLGMWIDANKLIESPALCDLSAGFIRWHFMKYFPLSLNIY